MNALSIIAVGLLRVISNSKHRKIPFGKSKTFWDPASTFIRILKRSGCLIRGENDAGARGEGQRGLSCSLP